MPNVKMERENGKIKLAKHALGLPSLHLGAFCILLSDLGKKMKENKFLYHLNKIDLYVSKYNTSNNVRSK